MCEGPGGSPTHPAINPALQSGPQQTVGDSGFIQYDHPAYSNDLTAVTTVCFEI